MADKNIQMTQRNGANNDWDNLFPNTKAANVVVTTINGLAGNNVQTVLQNLFQFANDGKTAVANAVAAKGVSASPSDTFAALATKIGQISGGKKVATGNQTFNLASDTLYTRSVTGLQFTPSLIVVYSTFLKYAGYSLYVNGFPGLDNILKSDVGDSLSGRYEVEITTVSTNAFNYTAKAKGFSQNNEIFHWVAFE
jgi:hypothetical protein